MRTILVIVSIFGLAKPEYYTDYWAVHVEGGPTVARSLAELHGFTYVDKVRFSLYVIISMTAEC